MSRPAESRRLHSLISFSDVERSDDFAVPLPPSGTDFAPQARPDPV